jgi:hypothetical protein
MAYSPSVVILRRLPNLRGGVAMARRTVRGIGVLFVTLLLPATLHAQYLDPGSGSILIQVLLGGVVGLAAIVKLYWHKIRRVLPGSKKAPPDGD